MIRKFTAVLYDTMLEIMHRKMLYLYAAVTVLITLIFLLVPSVSIDGRSIIDNNPTVQSFASTLIAQLFSKYMGFAMFLMVFGAAGLLPSYLNKGRVELNLSKPISRINLLLIKFCSVYLIMIGVMTLMCLPLWLVLSFRLDGPIWSFFPGLLVACIEFLVIYSIVFILGLLSNSTAVAIIGYFALSIGTGLLAKREFAYGFLGKAWQVTFDTIYNILPKMDEISDNIVSLISSEGLTNFYAIWSSVLFAAVMILLSILIFRKTDY